MKQAGFNNILKGLLFGLIILISVYVMFLIKVNRIQLMWIDTRMGFCHPPVYGLRVDDKEIVRFTLPYPKGECL